MKTWYAATCVICSRRYPISMFNAQLRPIVYPLQVVTGGGRARGFKTLEYLPWTSLPTLTQTSIWNNLLCLCARLATAYDNFFKILGFTSPEMQRLLQAARSYTEAYRPNSLSDYAVVYAPPRSIDAFVEAYDDDYAKTYADVHSSQLYGGICS
jgi:hypothetical protein